MRDNESYCLTEVVRGRGMVGMGDRLVDNLVFPFLLRAASSFFLLPIAHPMNVRRYGKNLWSAL